MLSFSNVLGPLGKEQYKVITHQSKLNELVEQTILPKSKSLRRLKLLITKNLIHIRGIVFEPNLLVKKIKPGDIFFDISLTKDEINKDEVRLAIKKFKIYNPRKRLDVWRWIDKYSNYIREKIMIGLTGPNSPFVETNEKNSLLFDLKFILHRIPTEASLLGQIAIVNIGLEKRRIVWYLESNVVLKSIIDYLGPKYLEVEKVDLDLDAIRLLTDLNFDEE